MEISGLTQTMYASLQAAMLLWGYQSNLNLAGASLINTKEDPLLHALASQPTKPLTLVAYDM